jgi:DNA (cytosine-5)-methyltransferase 1
LQAGYYGIPQNRWRTFVVATSDGTALPSFPLPTHEFPRIIIHGSAKIKVQPEIIKPNSRSSGKLELSSSVTVGDAISDLPRIASTNPKQDCEYASQALSDYQRLLRKGSSRVRDHICSKIEPVTLERICAVPRKPGAGWLDLPEHLKPANLKRHGDNRYANRYGRLDWGTIFNTILTRPHPYWSRVIHPEEDRLLSVRECARAQSFLDTTIFCGSMSEKFKQIGNAVPPLLAEKMGEVLIAKLRLSKINSNSNG